MELPAPSVDNKSLCLLPIPFTSNFLSPAPLSPQCSFLTIFRSLCTLLSPPEEEVENFDVSSLQEEALRNIEADSFWCMSKLLDGIQVNACVHLSERSQARSFVVSNYLTTSTKRVKHFSNPEHTRGQLKISSERTISISVFIHFNVVNLNHLKSKWRVFWCLCCFTACKASLTAWAWCIKQLLCVGFRKREGKKMVALHILKLEEGLESS